MKILQLVLNYLKQQKISFVFEYLPFGNLRSFVQKDKKRMSKKQRVDYVNQLIKSVSYLHNLGIIHIDLKPDK